MHRVSSLLTAFAALTLVACFGPPKPEATVQRIQFELSVGKSAEAPQPGDAAQPEGAAPQPVDTAPGASVSHGGATSARVITPTGTSNQLWPGTDGDVIEEQIGTVVHVLSGTALNDQWNVGGGQIAGAEWLFLKVVKVDKVPATGDEPGMREFSTTPVSTSSLTGEGSLYRVRFFGADRPSVGHVQGYVSFDDKGQPSWYRVEALPRKLLGPQDRDYRDGDIFEFRKVDKVDGSVGQLYPLK